MATAHAFAVCKIYQRIDDPKQTVCRLPNEPLPKGGAWRFIGARRVDDWSQNAKDGFRAGQRLDEMQPRATVTPDSLSHMQRPENRPCPPDASFVQKLVHMAYQREQTPPGQLPPLPPREGEEPRRRLLTPGSGFRVQEGPLSFWGPDANPQTFHV